MSEEPRDGCDCPNCTCENCECNLICDCVKCECCEHDPPE